MDSSPIKHASAGAVFRSYNRHLREYPFALLLVVLGIIAIQAGDLIAPLYLRKFFNILATNSPNDTATAALLGILGVVGFFWMIRWIGNRLEHFTNVFLESRVMARVFESSFEYLLGHSYDFFASRFAGSLTHKVSKFARAFEIMFDSIMLQFVPTFLFVMGATIILFFRHHALGEALGIWSILFVIFQVYVAKLRQPIRAERAAADTRVTGSLADAISNHATIMQFSGVQHEKKRFHSIVELWRRATIRTWFTDAVVWSALGIFIIGIQLGLLYGALLLWRKGLVTVGDFVLIQAYLLTVFDRLININRELRRFFDAFADASEMVELLDTEHEIRDQKGAEVLQVKAGAISFQNIEFHFNPDRLVLENFNLEIPSHQKTALVGPSGAGKSTITRLLLRMFDLQAGQILIDNQDIAKVTQVSLRDAISFVPQEPILFHRSLAENIRYGRRDASDEEIFEAARKAHCHEFISTLPDGYNTFVGERGIKLSGGERQRVAIARAILKDAPILVLDEATSSLDSESEALIQDALETLMQGKTVIVIAHRLSTIMKMDRIVVLERGKIVAEGTHRELVEHGGLYQKLWEIQAGGFLREPENAEEPAPVIAERDGGGDGDEERKRMHEM